MSEAARIGQRIRRAVRMVGLAIAAADSDRDDAVPTLTSGTGVPDHTAPDGSAYLRTDGTAATTLYVRAAGAWSALT